MIHKVQRYFIPIATERSLFLIISLLTSIQPFLVQTLTTFQRGILTVLLMNLSKNLNYRVYRFSFTSFDRGPSSCATLYNLFSTYTTRTARIFTGSIYLEHRNSPIHIDRDDTVSYG